MPTENQSQDIVKQFAAVDDASAASVSNVLSKQALEKSIMNVRTSAAHVLANSVKRAGNA